ncbi:MAG: CRISPR-associated protein Cas4 [Acutalibacteraceae bacterium]|nr:CRISPR-associated protein Cas4 [Acutalibacteraceae bacterium]
MLENDITGMQVYYYFVCHRKLWYFSNELCFENESENVKIGKIIDESTYKNKRKHIMIDNTINIDYIAEHKILHEIKKSRKIEEASIWQVKYYLYYLKNRGVLGLKGKIDYPLLKQSVQVELTADDEIKLDEIISDIKRIISLELPVLYDKKGFCKLCAYYDFCSI